MQSAHQPYAPYDSIHDPGALGLTSSTTDTAFGRLFHVRSERSGPEVTLFLHGVGGTWATWTPLLQCARDAGFDFGDVLLVDLPGFGSSENRQSHLDAAAVGQTLCDLVGELGWSRIRLVGHSMGGFLALDMASRDGTMLTSVEIVSGAYFSIVDTVQHPLRSLASRRGTALAYLSLVLIARLGPIGTWALRAAETLNLMPLLLGRMVAYPKRLPPSLIGYLSRAVAPRSFVLAAQNGKHYVPSEQWSRIRVPLRATFGSEDHLVPPADIARLLDAVPAASAVCLSGVGHFGHIERPDQVLAFLFDAG